MFVIHLIDNRVVFIGKLPVNSEVGETLVMLLTRIYSTTVIGRILLEENDNGFIIEKQHVVCEESNYILKYVETVTYSKNMLVKGTGDSDVGKLMRNSMEIV